MVRKIIYGLIGVLIFVLPFHNLILQVLISKFGFSQYLALYKDILVIGLIGVICLDLKNNFEMLKNSRPIYKLPLIFLVLINILAVLSSFVFNQVSLSSFVFGYYFEIWWVDLLAIVLTWYFVLEKNRESKNNYFTFLQKSLVFSYIGVCLFQVISYIIGQEKFLTSFGYGSGETGLVNSTITCHPLDFGISTCRAMGTFAHPLHFGGYLMTVIPFLIVFLVGSKTRIGKLFYSGIIAVGVLFVGLSYTRYSWLGLAVLIFVLFGIWLNKNTIISLRLFKIFTIGIVICSSFFSVAILSLNPDVVVKYIPKSIVKPSSTTWHYRHLGSTFEIIQKSGPQNITGYGLGSIGSAARAKYQDLNKNNIANKFERVAYNWYFVKETFLSTENWFLQTLLNGGLIYAILYFGIVLVPMLWIWKLVKTTKLTNELTFEIIIGIGFLTVLIGNNLEHLWESQTLAVYWSLTWLFGKQVKKKLLILRN
jgi:hypothetical protein